jgi:hypothetical protein
MCQLQFLRLRSILDRGSPRFDQLHSPASAEVLPAPEDVTNLRKVGKEHLMSAEWLMSSRDTEVAADIERQIVRNRRDRGGSGRRFRMNYATGLAIEDFEPVAEANPVAKQATV